MAAVCIKVGMEMYSRKTLLIIDLITDPGNPWYRVSKTGGGAGNGAVQGRSGGVGADGKADGNSAALVGSIDKGTGAASAGK